MEAKTIVNMYTDHKEDLDKFYKRVEEFDILKLADEMNQLRIDLELLGEHKTNVQKKYDAVRLNLIPSAMDDDGISNITVEGIGRISLTSDLYASIINEKKDEAYEWLREHKHGDLIQETVNAGSLKATFKRIIKKGKEVIPTEFFKITPFTRASITKTTKS